jgi:DNA-binding IclR family transcriptional regulator
MSELTGAVDLARTPPSEQDGAQLAVLRLLAGQPELSQRDLARALGVSLGKTHYLLHAMLDKGLVKAQRQQGGVRLRTYAPWHQRKAAHHTLVPQAKGG